MQRQIVGWSRLSILAVIVIVVVLALIAIPAYQNYTVKGRVSEGTKHAVLISLPTESPDDWVSWAAQLSEQGNWGCLGECTTSYDATVVPGVYTAKISLGAHIDGAVAAKLVREAAQSASPSNPLVLNLVPLFTDERINPTSDARSSYTYTYRGLSTVDSVEIPFAVHDDAEGCGQIWVSVWNDRLTVALDAFSISVPTGSLKSSDGCTLGADGRMRVTTGSRSTLFGLARGPDWRHHEPLVGLHVMELVINGIPKSKAVVVVNGQSAPLVIGWELGTSLSVFLDEARLGGLLGRARNQLNEEDPTVRARAYEALADHISRGIFPINDRPGVNQRSAEAGYNRLKDILSQNPEAKLVARFTTGGADGAGTSIYLPLSLLAKSTASLPTTNSNVIYPIPRMQNSVPPCIGHWTIAVPAKNSPVDSATDKAFARILQRPEMAWSTKPTTDIERLRSYFRHSNTIDQAEGLILLGHHNPRTGIYFELSDDPIDRNQIGRVFAPGSVAVMALCSTSAPASSRGVLTKLTENGFSTIVASPFQVSESYSIQLIDSLLAELDRSYSKNEPTLISELFGRASIGLEERMQYPEKAAQRLEYVLAGNPDARLCTREEIINEP